MDLGPAIRRWFHVGHLHRIRTRRIHRGGIRNARDGRSGTCTPRHGSHRTRHIIESECIDNGPSGLPIRCQRSGGMLGNGWTCSRPSVCFSAADVIKGRSSKVSLLRRQRCPGVLFHPLQPRIRRRNHGKYRILLQRMASERFQNLLGCLGWIRTGLSSDPSHVSMEDGNRSCHSTMRGFESVARIGEYVHRTSGGPSEFRHEASDLRVCPVLQCRRRFQRSHGICPTSIGWKCHASDSLETR
mmetsp:Transcript_19713/g.41462  ORF Transcript_19713/g.41462 Transcript_19713/m.41462 type:complete len:243 (+) Transcript_19713:230-958(+)